MFDINKSKLKLFVPFKVLENIKEPKALNMYIVVSILSITNYEESFFENEILLCFNNNAYA